MFNFKMKSIKKFDFILFFTMIVMCIFGLIMIKSTTLSFDTNRFVRSQTIAMVVGLLAIVVLVLLDYEFLGKLYIPIYIVSNALLVATLIWGFGSEKWGSDSWLEIAGVVFQPAEFVKIGLIISLAKFIDNNHETINQPFTLLKILGFAGLPVLLIMMQPDAGTAMVFVFFIALMLFVAGLNWRYIGYAFGALIVALPIMWFRLVPYQRDRFFNFLEPERDPTNTGYQAIQAKIAIGSGKIFGRGLYKGVQTQYNYIPEKETDFIYASLVEELGFIGGMSVIFLYFIFLNRLIKIAKDSKDLFGSLMVTGIAAMFVFHIWENIGMNIGLMPITGIPLPFYSQGGTFLLISMVSVGISLSVGMKRDALSF